ncbi:MAG: Gfo/Idh/MocA family oxidoreductase [Enterococcaceae bacterium]|jgi:myo-inositol 2-dehydrogenase/D-chiro-inositol 1-dehydrogenase|nr:Gfo/Idh/MocA family oxidoreductase [Enterococcaceae bacterium]MCI1920111.1 Gfo/Idh/MocA family oxidoreductase [Enterococcaceae bacterium]
MEKVKIAVIGLGRLGMVHTDHLVNLIGDADVKAVCALDQEQLSYAKENFGVETYTDYKKMIDAEEIDAVAIVAPTGFHPEMTAYALKAGKHVFCEKPLGLEMDEVAEMSRQIQEHPKQVFQLGFMRRFDASYRHAKEIIDAGGIGEIIYIRAYGIDPISGMESFTKFATDNDSGGIFVDMCIHDIDLIRWYTGSDPVQTWSIGNNIAAPELEAINEFETGVANLRFENNMAATLIGGRHAAHGNQVEMEIMGSNGWIRIAQEPEKDFVTLFTDAGVVRPAMQSFSERFTEAFITELKDFIENVKNDRQSDISVEDGVKALQIAKACKESAETGQVIDIVL